MGGRAGGLGRLIVVVVVVGRAIVSLCTVACSVICVGLKMTMILT